MPWIPIAAAVGVFVLVLGALGIWWLVKPDDTSSMGPTSTAESGTPTTTRAPRTTTENAQSAVSKLMALLPAGYTNGVCVRVHPPANGALATVDCGQATTPGGPANSRYSLFADQATLDSHFDVAIKENSELLPCPDSGLDSPTSWHYTATPTEDAGRIACGTYKGNPDLVWTKNSDLLLADAQGPNMDDLHKWWLEFA